MKTEVWIPTSRLKAYEKSFISIAMKAVKLGVDIPVLTITDEKKTFKIPCEHQIYESNAPKFSHMLIEKTKCIFKGEMPVIDGWKPIAKLDHEYLPKDNSFANIVNLARFDLDQKEIKLIAGKMNELSSCAPNCDHCKQNRARNRTFLLMNNKTNEIIQVGSTCVDDFLGEKSLAKIANSFDINSWFTKDYDSEYRDDYSSGKLHSYSVPLDLFVAIADKITRTNGFVSVSAASPTNPSTAFCIKKELLNPSGEFKGLINDYINENETDELKRAKKICEWMSQQKPDNSFIISCISISKKGFIELSDRFQVGVVASWPNSMLREEEKRLKKEMDAALNKNEHFGEEKQRGGLKLSLHHIYTDYDAMYPYIRLTMRDQDGRKFQWKTNPDSCPEVEVGKTYTMIGTIKSHEEYKGEKITQLARCSSIEECDPDSPIPQFIKDKKAAKKPRTIDDESSLSM
ncbi:hypothetical protein [Aeromonas sp. MrichA-1]|uniref:hypothetical protein n=1 Tax=Aeromonas sp. MrichA-1 TaxID=2823362 RepID=UPI001B33EB87|nr:hypothetical protein [Aeromonas sp. MrichA-1]MBP4081603.1 hypothetical protein [Aeromonas sp. MrichA-1]